MANFLDILGNFVQPGYSARPKAQPPAPSPPMPGPNPLRLPDPSPLSLLGELLSLPAVSPGEMQARKRNDPYGQGGADYGLSLPALTAEDQQKNKQNQARDDQARTAYQNAAKGEKQQGSLPSGDKGEAGNDEGANPEDEAGQADDLGATGPSAPATTRGPDGRVRVPVGPVAPVADPLRAAMLQAGLSLMVPQWGGGLAQLGQALGQGAAAAGRADELNVQEQRRAEGEADRSLKREATQADLDKTKAETAEIQSGESSRSRRLRGKTPSVLDEAAAAAGLGPKGKAYLQQRLKTLNQEDILGEDEDSVAKFNTIIEEAKRIDAPTSSPKAPAETPVPTAKAPNIGGTEQATNLPLVKSPEEANKLAPGTEFLFERNGKLERGRVPK